MFATTSLSLKDGSWSAIILILSVKEKGLEAVVNKEGHADSILGYERTHHYWFTSKICNNNKHRFLLQIPLAKFTLFTE